MHEMVIFRDFCHEESSFIIRFLFFFLFFFSCYVTFTFDSDPRFPPFYYMLGGNPGSLLYGDVSVMHECNTPM